MTTTAPEALLALADRVEADNEPGVFGRDNLRREILRAVAVEHAYHYEMPNGDHLERVDILSSLDAAAAFRAAVHVGTPIREPASAWAAAILRDLAHRMDAQARAHIRCADCRHSKVMADGSRKDRGWGGPCVSCAPATKPRFEPHPQHDGPWAITFRRGDTPVNGPWCDRLGWPTPALFATREAAERGAARAVVKGLDVDVVPHVDPALAQEDQTPAALALKDGANLTTDYLTISIPGGAAPIDINDYEFL